MFYVFHGENTHAQNETLTDLQHKMGDLSMLELNTTRFEGLISLSALRHACDAVPFLAQVRLVIVKDLFTAKPDKAFVNDLLAYLPELPETTRLFFLESKKLPANHRILKLAQEHESGYVKFFSRPEGTELERWIRQRVAHKNGSISPHAVYLLATNIGNDLQILDNEIEKLVLYKGDNGEIHDDDVMLLSPYAAEANIFDLVDAIGNRDGRKAATLLHKKLAEGADPFYLFSMIVRQFRLLIQVKELAEAGEQAASISRQLNMHTFVAGKLFQQCRHFTLDQLEQVYRHLLDVDVEVKSSQIEMTTALDLLVAGLTTPA